jgi:hypothetical protein
MWNSIGEALSQSLSKILHRLADVAPGLVTLIAVLLLAGLAAWAVSALLRRTLVGLNFDRRASEWGVPALAEWPPARSPTRLLVRIVWWAIVLGGFLIGATAFDETIVSRFMARVLDYLPNLVAAILVLAIGSFAARFLARSVLIGAVNMNLHFARLLSAGVKWLVTVLVVAMAMEHLGIGGDIIRLAFGILFGGIVLALALAVGLGSKELVSRSLDRESGRAPKEDVGDPVGHL